MLWSSLLCCLVLAGTNFAGAWQPQQCYEYEVEAKVHTYMDKLSSPYTGTLIRFKISITTITPTSYTAKIKHAESAVIDGTQAPDDEQWQHGGIRQFKPIPFSGSSVLVNVTDKNRIQNITMEKNVALWEMKMTRAIIQLFQIAPLDKPSKDRPFVQPPHSGDALSAVYHTSETNDVGQCDVVYIVSQLSAADMVKTYSSIEGITEDDSLITKSVNYSSCRHMAKFETGFSDDYKFVGGANAGGPVTRSSSTTAVINGTLQNFTIKLATTVSTFEVAPQLYSKQKAFVVSNITLHLRSITPCPTPQPKPWLPVDVWNPEPEQWTTEQQIYQLYKDAEFDDGFWGSLDKVHVRRSEPWSLVPPLPFQIGNNGTRIGDGPGRNISKMAAQMAKQASQRFHPEKHTETLMGLSHLLKLVKLLRTMTSEEILIAYRIVSLEVKSGNTMPQNITTYAIGLTGTPESMKFIHSIKSNISLEQLVELISMQKEAAFNADLPYLLYFWKIIYWVDSEYKRASPHEKEELQAAREVMYMKFTNTVRKVAVSKNIGEFIVKMFINYFSRGFVNAFEENNSVEIQLFTRALGNFAHKSIFEVFEEYIVGIKPATVFQRQMMVASMDHLTILYPDYIRWYWQSIYANASLPSGIRSLAVFHLMSAKPKASHIQQMAESTHYEPSTQVRAAVTSAIKSAAQLRGPHYHELAQNARAALPMLKDQEYDGSYTWALYNGYKVHGSDLSYTQFLELLGSPDSLFPSFLRYVVVKNYAGYRPGTQVTAMVSSVNETMDLIGRLFINPADKTHSFNEFEISPASIKRCIFRDICVEKRKPLEGNIQFPGGRLFAFDGKTLSKKINQLLDKMDGKNRPVSVQKIHSGEDLTIAFPNELGIPILFTYWEVNYVNITGVISAKKNNTHLWLPLNVKLNGQVHARFIKRAESKIGFFTGWDAMDYFSGYNTNTAFQYGVKYFGNFDIGKDLQVVSSDVVLKPTHKEKHTVVHRSSWPYVTKLWLLSDPIPSAVENPNTTLIHVRPPFKRSFSIGKETSGLVFDVEYSTEGDLSHISNIDNVASQFVKESPWLSMVYRWLYQQWKGYDLSSILHFPLHFHDVFASSFDVVENPRESTATSLKIAGTFTEVTFGGPKVEKYIHHPRSLGVPVRVDSEEQETTGTDVLAYDVYLNATFDGKTTASYGIVVGYNTSVVRHNASLQALKWWKHAVSSKVQLYKFEGSMKGPSVHLFNMREALNHTPNMTFNASFVISTRTWPKLSPSRSKSAQVILNGTFGRTPERQKYIQESPIAKACFKQMELGQKIQHVCQEGITWSNSLDAYDIDVRYLNVEAKYKRHAYHVYSFIRQLFCYDVKEEIYPRGQPENTLSASLKVNRDSTYFNFTINSVIFSSRGTYIKLQPWMKPLIVNAGSNIIDRVGTQIYPQYYEPSFVVDDGVLTTIDNRTYTLLPSKCPYVALAYAPKWPAEAHPDEKQCYRVNDLKTYVTVRKTSDGYLETIVHVEGNTIELIVKQEYPYVLIYVNGNLVDLKRDEAKNFVKGTILVHRLPGDEVSVYFRNSHVYRVIQDRKRLQVITHNCMRESVRGLAGNFNGEEQDDFVTPSGCIAKDPPDFVYSWNGDETRHHPRGKCVKPTQFYHPIPYNVKGFSFKEDSSSSSSSSSSSESEENPSDSPYLTNAFAYRPEVGRDLAETFASRLENLGDAFGFGPTDE